MTYSRAPVPSWKWIVREHCASFAQTARPENRQSDADATYCILITWWDWRFSVRRFLFQYVTWASWHNQVCHKGTTDRIWPPRDSAEKVLTRLAGRTEGNMFPYTYDFLFFYFLSGYKKWTVRTVGLIRMTGGKTRCGLESRFCCRFPFAKGTTECGAPIQLLCKRVPKDVTDEILDWRHLTVTEMVPSGETACSLLRKRWKLTRLQGCWLDSRDGQAAPPTRPLVTLVP